MIFSFLRRIILLSIIATILTACSTPIQSARPQYVPVHQGHLEYYRFGNGPPVVLIAGYATDISSWDTRFLTTLAQQHQVIVFNNRNVGRSFVRSSQYKSQDLANDTYQLIKNLRLKNPSVVGISMGGMIAQQLAVLHPEALRSLVLINTAIAGTESIHPSAETEKQMLNMPQDKLGQYNLALQLFFPSSQRFQMGIALALNRFQPQDYQEIDLKARVIPQQRDLILHWIRDNKTANKIPRVALPVLVLNGNADEVIPPENSIILASTFPDARFKRWEDGGHAMIFQHPVETADAINDFIDSLYLKRTT